MLNSMMNYDNKPASKTHISQRMAFASESHLPGWGQTLLLSVDSQGLPVANCKMVQTFDSPASFFVLNMRYFPYQLVP